MTRSIRFIVAIVLAGGLMLSACGVPADDAPRTINRSTTTTLPNQTTVPLSGAVGAPKALLYFLDDGHLSPTYVAVESDPDLAKAIGLVLATQPEAPLQTRIPPGTKLLSSRVEGSVASINLSGAIEDIGGPAQKEAYAQLVFTALVFSQITSVKFRVQGSPVDAPTDNGNLAMVTADDYSPPLNPR